MIEFKKVKIVITLQLDDDLEKRLEALSIRTGRSKKDCIREAILEYLEEVEDRELAMERLNHPTKKLTMEEVEKNLGLED
ncbi:ribbon-helix-helix protein, CopG family [bacterium]|nr:ribbon-helix-helix protein, CopG family [bacterium]